jgi:uncharacterized protein with HEPN domain
MRRRDLDRLTDIEVAIAAVHEHVQRGSIEDGLIFDAVRARLIEIGEAVKGLADEARQLRLDIPWSDIAGMRDTLAHRYFDTSHAVVQATVEQELAPLLAAVHDLRASLGA